MRAELVDRMDMDVAWAAGIIEGEGCFSMFDKQHPSGNIHKQCAIHCEMTDEDVINKLQKILGVGNITYRDRKDGIRKPSWILSIQKQKDIFNTLIQVMPFMKSRRLEKCKEMFSYLEEKVV